MARPFDRNKPRLELEEATRLTAEMIISAASYHRRPLDPLEVRRLFTEAPWRFKPPQGYHRMYVLSKLLSTNTLTKKHVHYFVGPDGKSYVNLP